MKNVTVGKNIYSVPAEAEGKIEVLKEGGGMAVLKDEAGRKFRVYAKADAKAKANAKAKADAKAKAKAETKAETKEE